jgi:hypothetical protein
MAKPKGTNVENFQIAPGLPFVGALFEDCCIHPVMSNVAIFRNQSSSFTIE